jgi:hypothetical protein
MLLTTVVQKNKRMNRAQKRRAEGVHKLKLQPIIKPKTVKPCYFYNHGKCQQVSFCAQPNLFPYTPLTPVYVQLFLYSVLFNIYITTVGVSPTVIPSKKEKLKGDISSCFASLFTFYYAFF